MGGESATHGSGFVDSAAARITEINLCAMKLTEVKTSPFKGGSPNASTQAAQVNSKAAAQTAVDLNNNSRRLPISACPIPRVRRRVPSICWMSSMSPAALLGGSGTGPAALT